MAERERLTNKQRRERGREERRRRAEELERRRRAQRVRATVIGAGLVLLVLAVAVQALLR